MAMLEVRSLSYTYKDGTHALQNLSFAINKGRKVAILGPNGAGKSTVLLHLNGILIAQSGEVLYNGEQISKKNERWVRSQVGIVFQDPDDQVFSSTVFEDVAFGPTNMGLIPEEVARRTSAALLAVGMDEYKQKAPHHLSFGQKKRVAIAGVLAMQPEVIILDEPVTFLDPQGKDTVFLILETLNNQGKTIIIATHDVDVAAEWADDIIIIKDGSTLVEGTTVLLTNQDIVKEAHLRLPIIARLFNMLGGVHKDNCPKTIEEAVSRLRPYYPSDNEQL